MSAKLCYGFNLAKEKWPYMTLSENEYIQWMQWLENEPWYYSDDFDFFGIEIASTESLTQIPKSFNNADEFNEMVDSFYNYFPSSTQKPDLYLLYEVMTYR